MAVATSGAQGALSNTPASVEQSTVSFWQTVLTPFVSVSRSGRTVDVDEGCGDGVTSSSTGWIPLRKRFDRLWTELI
ncbi:hypothetical protein GCM10009734_23190 [Nonomuraea bangladeshensis]